MLEYALGDPIGLHGAATDWWRSGLEMACALYGYWQISGMLREGGYWLSKALE